MEPLGLLDRLRAIAWRGAAAVFRRYHRTLRVWGITPDGDLIRPHEFTFEGKLYAVSERDLVALGGFLRETTFAVIIAHGRDGDWATRLVEASGGRVFRGSSLRGGRNALHGTVAHLRATSDAACFVVDGPLGPVGVAKPGAVVCAARTGRPLVTAAASAAWRVTVPRTWSGIYVPLPFSAVFVAFVTAGVAPDVDVAARTEQLTRDLVVLRRRAAAACRTPDAAHS